MDNEIIDPESREESQDEVAVEAETDDSSIEIRPSNSQRNLIIAAVSIILITFLIVAYWLWSRPTTTATTADTRGEVVVSVKVAKAETDTIAQDSTAIGTIVPAEQATVAASISAQIRQMGILKNNLVAKGDLLAVLSSDDLVAQRNEAQAALEEARLNLQTVQRITIPQATSQSDKDLSDARAAVDNKRAIYERRKILYEKGGISLKELEASQLELTNAQNAYRLAQQNSSINRSAVNPNSQAIATAKIKQAEDRLAGLDIQAKRGEIRAPITGFVTEQFQYEGEFASQGAKLLTIADISQIIVKAQFADVVVKDLKVGDVVTIKTAQTQDEPMTGSVTLISRSSDTQSRTVEVWARFGNPRGLLLSGGSAEMVVSSNAVNDAIVVPASAVTLETSNGDEGSLMLVDGNSIAHETKVKIGIKQGDKIQIVEGIKEGDTVVTEGNYSLPDGTKVEIAKDGPDAEK